MLRHNFCRLDDRLVKLVGQKNQKPKFLVFGKYVYMYYTCIDQMCVEVFEKTIRGTEMIDHSFERKFRGVWNRLC